MKKKKCITAVWPNSTKEFIYILPFYDSFLISLTSLSSLQPCKGTLSMAAGFFYFQALCTLGTLRCPSHYPVTRTGPSALGGVGMQLSRDLRDVGTSLICTHTTSAVSLHLFLFLPLPSFQLGGSPPGSTSFQGKIIKELW